MWCLPVQLTIRLLSSVTAMVPLASRSPPCKSVPLYLLQVTDHVKLSHLSLGTCANPWEGIWKMLQVCFTFFERHKPFAYSCGVLLHLTCMMDEANAIHLLIKVSTVGQSPLLAGFKPQSALGDYRNIWVEDLGIDKDTHHYTVITPG